MNREHPHKGGKPFSDILLVSDMDDTLLNDKKQVSACDMEAISKFCALGGTFTVATGRSIPSYLPYKDILNISVPVIINNGAVIYNPIDDCIVWHSVLPKPAHDFVGALLVQFPDIGAEVLTKDRLYVLRMSPQVEAHTRQEFLPYRMTTAEEIHSQWIKVLFALHADLMPEFNGYLTQHLPQGLDFLVSSRNYCELLAQGTSKGGALRRLREMPEHCEKKVYAIGDYYNDIDMLDAADVSAAVSHAPDLVKQHADLVLPGKDALAAMVKHIISEIRGTWI